MTKNSVRKETKLDDIFLSVLSCIDSNVNSFVLPGYVIVCQGSYTDTRLQYCKIPKLSDT